MKKTKMNKKGEDGWSTSQKFILLLVTLIVLVSATYGITKPADRAGSINKCKTWIAIESAPIAGKTFGIKSFGFFDLNSPCETWKVNVGKNEEIYETLANEMYTCWDMYGRGEKNWYSDWSPVGGIGKKNTEKNCLVCSEIRFDEELFENNQEKSIDLNELWTYMSSHQIPGRAETYTEYFLKSENANINTPSFQNSKFDVSQDKPVYVTFHITKGDKSYLGQGLATTGGAAAGVTSSYLLGTAIAGGSAAATAGTVATTGTVLTLGGSFLGETALIASAGTAGAASGAGIAAAIPFMFSPIGLGIIAVGITAATVTYYAVDDSYIAPSLMIFGYDKNNEANVKPFCDNIYYKPREGVWEKLKNENSNV